MLGDLGVAQAEPTCRQLCSKKVSWQLTLGGPKIPLPRIPLSVALLHNRAVLDVVLFGLATRLADISRRWGTRATGALELALRAFTNEMLGLELELMSVTFGTHRFADVANVARRRFGGVMLRLLGAVLDPMLTR